MTVANFVSKADTAQKGVLTSMAGSNLSRIQITPNRAMGGWEVYIPPTRPEHFEGYPGHYVFHSLWGNTEREDFLMGQAILGPWGESYWTTLEDALAFIEECRAAGQIAYNDGEVVR